MPTPLLCAFAPARLEPIQWLRQSAARGVKEKRTGRPRTSVLERISSPRRRALLSWLNSGEAPRSAREPSSSVRDRSAPALAEALLDIKAVMSYHISYVEGVNNYDHIISI